MLLLRKILFYLFFAIYLFLCPLIILYALGINFNPKTQTMKKTGVISISTIPAGATVYVDNELLPEKTPTVIRDLAPKNYFIRLTLDDYRSWENILSVEEEKAVTAENILLIPLQWRSQKLSATSFNDLMPAPSEPYLLLSQGPLAKYLLTYRQEEGLNQTFFSEDKSTVESKNLRPVFPEDLPYREGKVLKVFSTKQSPFFLVKIDFKGSERFLWIDSRSKQSHPQDITPLFPENPGVIKWDRTEDKSIFISVDGTVNRLDIHTKAIYPSIIQNVRAFDPSNQQLYVLADDYLLRRLNYDATNLRLLPESFQSNPSLLKKYDQLDMLVLTENVVLFLSKKGALLSNLPPYHFLDSGIRGWDIDPGSKRVLIWTKDGIGILDIVKGAEGEIPPMALGLSWLAVKSENIEQAFWVNDNAQILYREGHKVFVVEAKNFGLCFPNKIVDIKDGSSINYSDENKTLFYLGPKTGQLSSIEITSQKPIASMPELEPSKTEEKNKNGI